MMTQLTTSDDAMGMPPNSGMVNAVSFSSASSRACLKPSKQFHLVSSPILPPGRVRDKAYEHKKSKTVQTAAIYLHFCTTFVQH